MSNPLIRNLVIALFYGAFITWTDFRYGFEISYTGFLTFTTVIFILHNQVTFRRELQTITKADQ